MSYKVHLRPRHSLKRLNERRKKKDFIGLQYALRSPERYTGKKVNLHEGEKYPSGFCSRML